MPGRKYRTPDIEMGEQNQGFSSDDDHRDDIRRRASANSERVKRPVRPHTVPSESVGSSSKKGSVFAVTSKILSAVLIITNVVLDWVQYTGMDDSVEKTHILNSSSNATKDLLRSNISSEPNPTKECLDGSEKDELTKKFLYFNIAGTLLALLQLINIIVQIKGKLSANKKGDKKRLGLDGKLEVFLVTILIEIPQNYMLLRYEDICINNCNIEWDMKKIMRFSNGLSSVICALWRYITSISLPRSREKEEETSCSCCGGCDDISMKCAKRCQNCIEDCFFCICPWFKCFSKIGCRLSIPCCFSVVCKCRGPSNCITVEPECCCICCCKCCCSKEKVPKGDVTWKSGDDLIVIVVSIAPTVIHVIMYTMRIVKYFCGASNLEVFEFLYKYIESNINNVMKWVIDKIPTF